MVSVTILTVLKSPRFIWLTLFMVAIFLGNVSQSNANDRRDKYNISNLTRHLSALQYNQNKKFFYAQNNIPPPSNQNSVPKATVAEKKVSTPPPHDHFAYSPARPFCENCFEHGVFSPRFRGGLQLFESTGDGDKSSSSSLLPPSVPYKGSTEPSRKPKWCKDVVIVQGDTRMPSLTAIGNDLLPKDYDYSTFADSIMGNGAQSVIDATFLINSAYAYLHDYGYVFLTINYFAIGYRGLEWGNVAILRHVAKVCPAATVLYLDSDAYIRDLASEIAVEKIKAYRHSNDAGLDKLVLPKYPGAVGPSTPFLLAAPIECQWMTWLNAQPQLNRCFNMQQHNSLFRTQGWSGDAHAGGGSPCLLILYMYACMYVFTISGGASSCRGSQHRCDDGSAHREGPALLGEVVAVAGAAEGPQDQAVPHKVASGAANIGEHVMFL